MNHVWGEFLAAVKFAGADPPGEFRRKTPFEAAASAAAAIFEPIRRAAERNRYCLRPLPSRAPVPSRIPAALPRRPGWDAIVQRHRLLVLPL
jgi:hypothetical protein